MEIAANRMRGLRESIGISQNKLSKELGVGQSSINRYESGEASPPYELLVKLADYYDVSLDYILGRTDEPCGKLYEYKPKCEIGNQEMKSFIEMCFKPGSPMNERLKATLVSMMEGKVES